MTAILYVKMMQYIKAVEAEMIEFREIILPVSFAPLTIS